MHPCIPISGGPHTHRLNRFLHRPHRYRSGPVDRNPTPRAGRKPAPVTVDTRATYSGPARLTPVDGTLVSGMASLSTNQRGGIEGWGGTFRPDQASEDIRNASDGLSLELPY